MSPRQPLTPLRQRALGPDPALTQLEAGAEPSWDLADPLDAALDAVCDHDGDGDGDGDHDGDGDTDGSGRLRQPPEDEPEPSAGQAGAAGHHPALTLAGAARSTSPAEESQLVAWIAGVVVHDEAALAALYDHTARRVHGLVLRITRCPALAEEVVEDTFFQVWRQAARFDPARGRALTWLLAMARSRAIDTLRREARNQHQALSDDAEAEAQAAWGNPGPAADDLLDVARSHAELHRAMLLLNAQPRQLVALAFLRGLSHEEIASTTALPLGTVKSQIRRALNTLKQLLGDKPLVAPVR